MSELTEGLNKEAICEHVVCRDGSRDLSFRGWLVGVGEHSSETRHPFGTTRAVIVSIYITEGGSIVTAVKRYSSDASEFDRFTAQGHQTATDALEWLARDALQTAGLGRASKEAWGSACETVPSLSGETVERLA